MTPNWHVARRVPLPKPCATALYLYLRPVVPWPCGRASCTKAFGPCKRRCARILGHGSLDEQRWTPIVATSSKHLERINATCCIGARSSADSCACELHRIHQVNRYLDATPASHRQRHADG